MIQYIKGFKKRWTYGTEKNAAYRIPKYSKYEIFP